MEGSNLKLVKKIKIFPTPEQDEVLWKLSETCRFLYNYALSERKTAWEQRHESIGYLQQQNALPALKTEFPWIKVVYSKVLQTILKRLDQDYNSFYILRKKDIRAKPPRFKGNRYFTTLSYNQSGFQVKPGLIRVSHKYNDVPLVFKIPEKFMFETVKQVELYRTRDGDYYISIIYEGHEKPYTDNGQYQAIDLGITHIVTAVNSKGRFLQIRTPRPDKYWQPKLEEVQSKRDHCLEDSHRWHRYNVKLLQMQKKCSDQLKDFQHKLSRKLVENTKSQTLIIGELNIKDMAEKKRNRRTGRGLRRAIQSTGLLARFARLLTYKATCVGKKVVAISEVNTSKICCRCGTRHGMPVWARIMECECGNVLDRDKNAAVNIMRRFLSQNALVDRLSSFEEMLRQTAEWKTRVAPQGLGGLAGSSV